MISQEEYLQTLVAAATTSPRMDYWGEASNTFRAAPGDKAVSSDLFFQACLNVSDAMHQDWQNGLIVKDVLATSWSRISRTVLAIFDESEFDKKAFCVESTRYLNATPQAIENDFQTRLISRLVRKVGGEEAFLYFRLCYRIGSLGDKRLALRSLPDTDKRRFGNFLERLKEEANGDGMLRHIRFCRLREIGKSETLFAGGNKAEIRFGRAGRPPWYLTVEWLAGDVLRLEFLDEEPDGRNLLYRIEIVDDEMERAAVRSVVRTFLDASTGDRLTHDRKDPVRKDYLLSDAICGVKLFVPGNSVLGRSGIRAYLPTEQDDVYLCRQGRCKQSDFESFADYIQGGIPATWDAD